MYYTYVQKKNKNKVKQFYVYIFLHGLLAGYHLLHVIDPICLFLNLLKVNYYLKYILAWIFKKNINMKLWSGTKRIICTYIPGDTKHFNNYGSMRIGHPKLALNQFIRYSLLNIFLLYLIF